MVRKLPHVYLPNNRLFLRDCVNNSYNITKFGGACDFDCLIALSPVRGTALPRGSKPARERGSKALWRNCLDHRQSSDNARTGTGLIGSFAREKEHHREEADDRREAPKGVHGLVAGSGERFNQGNRGPYLRVRARARD